MRPHVELPLSLGQSVTQSRQFRVYTCMASRP